MFDPTDLALRAGPLAPAFAAMAAMAPHTALNWVYGLLAGGTFALLSSPSGETSDGSVVVLVTLTFATLVAWPTLFFVHLFSRLAVWIAGIRQPPWSWRWAVIPVVLAVGFAVQRSGALFAARWWIARNGFDAAVRSAKPEAIVGHWVRGMHVTGIDTRRWSVPAFVLGWPDAAYSDGPPVLIYQPGSQPMGGPQVVDLGGGWWIVFDNT